MIYLGVVVSSLTELLERFVNLGAFYLSPTRIFLLALAYTAYLAYCAGDRLAAFGPNAKRYSLSVSALLALTAASTVASPDLEYSIKRVLNTTSIYIFPIVIYLFLQVSRNRYPVSELMRKTGQWIVRCGVFLALFGYLQEFTGWLQFSQEVRSILGVPYTRINSLFYDGNFFAYYLIFPLWLCVVGDHATTGIASRSWRWLFALLMFGAVLLSGSRGGLIMIVAAAYSHVIYRHLRSRPGWIVALEAPLVILLPLGLLLSAYYGFELIYANVSSIDTGTESGFSRVLAWYSGFRLWLDSPWIGVGPGNFVTMDKGKLLPGNYVQPWVALRISALAAHSNVLETLVESGAFTLLAYFLVQLTIYLALLRASIVYGDHRFAVYRSIYFAAAIGNTFISYLSLFFMIIIGILLFAMDSIQRSARATAVNGNRQFGTSLQGVTQ